MSKTLDFFRVVFKWCLRYPVAIVVSIFVIVVVIVLWKLGIKNQIGGLLGKLWGTETKTKSRITVVSARVDENGNPIPIGKSDSKGYVQSPASVIKEPGIFSDPNVVEIIDDNGNIIKINLPTGVKNGDVKEVVKIAPNVYEVKNNDGGMSIHELNSLDKILNP